jgi:hypothetical protein
MSICAAAPGCVVRSPGECVYYSGDYLSILNITNGENLNSILNKVNTYLSGNIFSETANAKVDSNSIAIILSGSNNRTIRADLRVNPALDNKVVIGASGVYVAPSAASVSYNTTTNVLSITIDGVLSTVTLPAGVFYDDTL